MRVFTYLSILLSTLCGACSWSEPGIEVDVVSSALAWRSGHELTTNLDYRVHIEALSWSSTRLRLRACEAAELGLKGASAKGARAGAFTLASLATRVSGFWIGSAQAHGAGSPTELAAPTVESAFGESDSFLGTLRPPAGRYCGVRYEIGPADADANGLGVAPHMLGLSVYARGTYSRAGEPAAAFEISSGSAVDVSLSGFELDVRNTAKHVTLRLAREPDRLFDYLDFSGLAAEDTAASTSKVLASTLLANLGASARVALQD